MLDTEKLTVMLEKGRLLHKEIAIFIKKPDLVSSQALINRIDKLIRDIKPQLLNPSITEDNQMSLVITRLGSIVKNFTTIKRGITKII